MSAGPARGSRDKSAEADGRFYLHRAPRARNRRSADIERNGCYRWEMVYLLLKAAISGAIIAGASEVARRWPGVGGVIVSLPLVSILTFLWLWRDTGGSERVAQLGQSAFWFFLPSMPMFLVLPAMLRAGSHFWLALGVSIALTALLYLGMFS